MKTTDELENMIQEDESNLKEILKNEKHGKLMLAKIIKDQNLSVSKVSHALGLNNYLYEILDLKSKKQVARNKLLAILIYLNVDLKTMNEILQKFGYSKVYVKVASDALIYYAINNYFTLEQTNELLINHGYDALL